MKFSLYPHQHILELGQRGNQEDCVTPLEGALLSHNQVFVVCDGMGGHNGGEVASQAVCESLVAATKKLRLNRYALTEQQLYKLIETSYQHLDRCELAPEHLKMGTTMTFLAFHRGGATVAHIGDSRVYQFRPGMKSPLFVTRDHSLVNELVTAGELTADEARTSTIRNVITKAMQPHEFPRVMPDSVVLTDIRRGDWFFLCTDGMLENMDDAELTALITNKDLTDREKCVELRRRTTSNSDNHSAILIRIRHVYGRTARALFSSTVFCHHRHSSK